MRCAIPEQQTRDDLSRKDLPQIAAALLDVPARARSECALHHQFGSAEFYRQYAARRRLRAVDDSCRPKRSAPSLRAATRCLVNLGTFDRERRKATERAVEAARHDNIPWVLDPVFVDRAQHRADFANILIARGPKVLRLNRAEYVALAGGAPTHSALAAYAREHDLTVGLSGETDQVADGDAARDDRQRPCADGQSDGYGLRGVGPGRGLSGYRAGRLARHDSSADHHRRRRTNSRRPRQRPGQLCGRHLGCAL